jgi:hypothetical protein
MLLSYSSNPPLARTGAPGESTCAGCHGGGAGGGGVSIGFAGTTYTPGVKQRLNVMISDPVAVAYGYELTAVQAGATSTGAGTFAAADTNSSVRPGAGTNSTKSYAAQVNSLVSTYLVDWTPPATNVGNVTFYIATVAGDGNQGSADSIYTSSVTLAPAVAASLSASPSSLSFSYTQKATNPPAQTIALSSTGSALSYTVASSATWLTASPTSGSTPGTISVSVNPSGLAAGTYNGSLSITATGASNSPLTVPVTLTVTAAPSLGLNPTTLNFTAQAGSSAPAAQNVAVTSSGAALSYSATTSAAWLMAAPATGSTPGTLSVSVNPAGLTAGTYSGTVSVASTAAANSPQRVSVSFTITAPPNPNLILSPASLSFNYQSGGTTPAAQNVAVTSSGAALSYSATASAAWLMATPAAGSTPGTLSVSVNPSGLAVGSYNGTVSVAATGAANSPQQVSVSLTVTAPAAPNLTLSPASLTFNYQAGGTTPATQNVSVSSGGPALSYSAATSAAWLTLASADGTTPGTLTVGVNPTGLAAGSYTATVTVTAIGAANTPQKLSVTLNVTAPGTGSLHTNPRRLWFYAGGEGESDDGGSNQLTKQLWVTSTTPVQFTTEALGGSWLSLSAGGSATPTRLTVSVSPVGLARGSYTAQIQITAAGLTSITVPVTLSVRGSSDDSAPLSTSTYTDDPANTGGVSAQWMDGAGVPVNDASDRNNQGLVLTNNASAKSKARAGVILHNVAGLTLNALGYDVRDGSLCNAGGPRFIVVTSDDVVHTVGGCPSANAQAGPASAWKRFRFVPAQLTPAIAPGATVKSIALTLDVGPDAGACLVVLDNIDVNGTIIGHE